MTAGHVCLSSMGDNECDVLDLTWRYPDGLMSDTGYSDKVVCCGKCNDRNHFIWTRRRQHEDVSDPVCLFGICAMSDKVPVLNDIILFIQNVLFIQYV